MTKGIINSFVLIFILQEAIDLFKERKNEILLLDSIKKFLEKYNYSYNFTVYIICEELGLSRSTLHRRLKKETGYSASNIINSIRLEKAHAILMTSPNSVREVSERVGFSSPKYFSKLYFKKYNRLPSSYLR